MRDTHPVSGSIAVVAFVAFAALGAAAIGGCSGASTTDTRRSGSLSNGPGATGALVSVTASSQLNAATQDATVMQVTLGSGPDSGAHTASSSSITCTHGLAAPGNAEDDSLGNQFADDSSVGLSAVDLIVPAMTVAAHQGTDDFLLSVSIGKPSKKHVYKINTLSSTYGVGKVQGTGHVMIDDEGASGTVTVGGQAGDGTALQAVIHCNRILDADGRPRQ